jgi:hypothetical protein
MFSRLNITPPSPPFLLQMHIDASPGGTSILRSLASGTAATLHAPAMPPAAEFPGAAPVNGGRGLAPAAAAAAAPALLPHVELLQVRMPARLNLSSLSSAASTARLASAGPSAGYAPHASGGAVFGFGAMHAALPPAAPRQSGVAPGPLSGGVGHLPPPQASWHHWYYAHAALARGGFGGVGNGSGEAGVGVERGADRDWQAVSAMTRSIATFSSRSGSAPRVPRGN